MLCNATKYSKLLTRIFKDMEGNRLQEDLDPLKNTKQND